jgi:hypothetical protein
MYILAFPKGNQLVPNQTRYYGVVKYKILAALCNTKNIVNSLFSNFLNFS